MFIHKTARDRATGCVISCAWFVSLFVLFSFFTTSPSFSASLAQNTPTATPVATEPVTLTVSPRCLSCITWPNSDKRLDVAHGDGSDLDKTRLEGLKDIPLVLYFRVADNGNLLPYHELEYTWDKSCNGGHSVYLSPQASAFITSYNPTFFDGTVIDSVTQYTQFVPFLQTHISKTLIGAYTSATTCLAGSTNPFAEHYYPSNAVDCYQLTPQGPAGMGTRPWLPQYCPAQPARWYIDVANGGVRARFLDNVTRTVLETEPKPPFVFLDHAFYMEPEFVWKTGERSVDCRDRASATLPDCSNYAYRQLQKQFGRGIYFDDYMELYRALITRLEQAKIRSILNIVTPPAVIAYERDRQKYAQQFEDLIGQNGVAFEYPFHINSRTNFTDTLHEIELHQRLLKDGKLVIFATDYANENASSWMAAMAMLMREPGQSLFVARDAYSSTLEWIDWPARYGAPGVTDTVHPLIIADRRSSVGENWFISRQFTENGITREITATHFGVNLQNLKTFTLTMLAPDVERDTYKVLYEDPKLGIWNEATNVYTATHRTDENGAVQADHFILGAHCSGTPQLCKKLIAVSVGVFK